MSERENECAKMLVFFLQFVKGCRTTDHIGFSCFVTARV